jgi:hypothetical protein
VGVVETPIERHSASASRRGRSVLARGLASCVTISPLSEHSGKEAPAALSPMAPPTPVISAGGRGVPTQYRRAPHLIYCRRRAGALGGTRGLRVTARPEIDRDISGRGFGRGAVVQGLPSAASRRASDPPPTRPPAACRKARASTMLRPPIRRRRRSLGVPSGAASVRCARARARGTSRSPRPARASWKLCGGSTRRGQLPCPARYHVSASSRDAVAWGRRRSR